MRAVDEYYDIVATKFGNVSIKAPFFYHDTLRDTTLEDGTVIAIIGDSEGTGGKAA
jgi:hypothetical protein